MSTFVFIFFSHHTYGCRYRRKRFDDDDRFATLSTYARSETARTSSATWSSDPLQRWKSIFARSSERYVMMRNSFGIRTSPRLISYCRRRTQTGPPPRGPPPRGMRPRGTSFFVPAFELSVPPLHISRSSICLLLLHRSTATNASTRRTAGVTSQGTAAERNEA